MAQPLNITRVQFYVFLATMFISIGAYVAALGSWDEVVTPGFIGAVAVAVGKDIANFLMGRSRTSMERRMKLEDLEREIPKEKKKEV